MLRENINLQQFNQLIDCMPAVLTELSDDAVCAVAQTAVAVQNLIVACGLDDIGGCSDDGHRINCKAYLDRIYNVCAERCADSRDLVRTAKIAAVMYHISYHQMRLTDAGQKRECQDAMYSVVNECLRTVGHSYDSLGECAVLRCIVNAFQYVAEDERHEYEEFAWLKQRVSEWTAEMQSDGSWHGVSDVEALSRLDIMVRNSDVLLDAAHDAHIERAREFYCRSVLDRILQNIIPKEVDFVALDILYEVIRTVGYDSDALNKIACYAEHYLWSLPKNCAPRMLCLKICIVHECTAINDAVKRQVLARTA